MGRLGGEESSVGNRLLIGDCREQLATLPAGCAQTCVTSPPYWGLRDYGHGDQLGLESTPDEYVARMVEVFREVRRVLRDDGTLWLNLGDSYAATGKSGGGSQGERWESAGAITEGPRGGRWSPAPPGLKPKDLVGIPWRVAFALQADGWYLRSDIIWHKPNPMPESVTDRPTKAHEHLFLLSKSERYYYDAEAIAESAGTAGRARVEVEHGSGGYQSTAMGRRPSGNQIPGTVRVQKQTRNKRTVWTVASQPYADAHFATFPPNLIKPCILAGTSEAGCCATCGAPRDRVVARDGGPPNNRFRDGLAGDCKTAHNEGTVAGAALSRLYQKHGYPTIRTTGWRPTCDCGAASEPCVVLDPFLGSGTTAQVAQDLERRWIGVELNPDYEPLIRQRTAQASLGLMVGNAAEREVPF